MPRRDDQPGDQQSSIALAIEAGAEAGGYRFLARRAKQGGCVLLREAERHHQRARLHLQGIGDQPGADVGAE